MEPSQKKGMSRILSAKIFGFAVLIHVAFFSLLSFVMWFCLPNPETLIPIDLMIVPPWAEKTDDPEVDPNPPKEEEKVEEKEEKEEEIKEEKRDVIIKEKPKPKVKPIVKGKLIKKPPKPFNKSKKLIKSNLPAGKGTASEKPLSAADIQKFLNQGYKFGSKNQIAANEVQRCVSVIGEAIKKEWNKESFNWYPGLKPIQVTLRFGSGGTITKWNIVSSSGDNDVDRTARNALTRLRRISGLSMEFLSKYSEITVEMKPVQ